MVLFLLEETRAGSFAAVLPVEPSAAQRATLGLLVEGRLGL